MATTMVHVRVDEKTKQRAAKTLAAMGMSVSGAVRMLLVRVAAARVADRGGARRVTRRSRRRAGAARAWPVSASGSSIRDDARLSSSDAEDPRLTVSRFLLPVVAFLASP